MSKYEGTRESQARNKYTYFASVAKLEYWQIFFFIKGLTGLNS